MAGASPIVFFAHINRDTGKEDFFHWVLLYEDINPKATEPTSEPRGGVADTAACNAEKQNLNPCWHHWATKLFNSGTVPS